MLEELNNLPTVIRVQSWELGAPVSRDLEDFLAVEWPTTVGVVATDRIGSIACLSPTEWLVIGTDLDAVPLLQFLQTSLAGTAFRATVITQALARIEIKGEEARLLLAKGCSLDLHPSRFSAGRCARTRLAGMTVILWCTRECTFQCIVASSYREYLIAWLADAALELKG
jgi:sarcosine oxidase, subunit gamma